MPSPCRICGETDIITQTSFPESTFGTGEWFLYQQCGDCRCFQIVTPPAQMGEYYPSHYYAYAPSAGNAPGLKARLRNFLSQNGPEFLFAGRPWWEQGDRKSLRDAGVSRSDRILDIGCGRGDLIASLKDIGFKNLVGADPFIAEDITHPNGVRVLKQDVHDIDGPFDCVMMHHSLEHVWDQKTMAQELARLLSPGGRCIIRIPTIDSWAWEEYGANWIQLDPPRHFYLHSRASITRLLQAAGLEVTAIIDDSHAFQILGSEKMRRGQSLFNPQTGKIDYADCLPSEMIETAPSRAKELNKRARGDAIAVHAKKPKSNSPRPKEQKEAVLF